MKIEPLSIGSTYSNLVKWNKKLKLNSLAYTEKSDTAIVLSDGTPDDIAIFILATKLDGKKVVYLIKPEGKTRYGALDNIFKYAKNDKIILVMDQENEELDDIIKSFTGQLKQKGVEILEKQNIQNRLYRFDSQLGPKKFELYLVINGLDKIETKNHTIEDHLLECAKQAGMSVPTSSDPNSKELWKEIIKDEKNEEKVYREVLSRTEECFPQQYAALKSVE